MTDWNNGWEQHKRDYPIGVCAICPKCGGSSMSDCPCAKQSWIINEQQRHGQVPSPPIQLEQCFWCQKQVVSVANVKLLNKYHNLCRECIIKLM